MVACSHHSGQMCAAGSRIFVQEGIYDRFLKAFTDFALRIKFGNGFEQGNQQGPLVSNTQFEVCPGHQHSPSPDRVDNRSQRVMGYK